MAPKNETLARRWLLRGRVQGVGFRYFAQRAAQEIGVPGYARNLDEGGVEVFAMGSEEQLSKFSARIRKGPEWADVRAVEELEAAPEDYTSFQIN